MVKAWTTKTSGLGLMRTNARQQRENAHSTLLKN